VPLAAPGPQLVPGTDAGSPRWLLGIFGAGLGLDGDAYLVAIWIAFGAYLVVVASAGTLGGRAVGFAVIAAVVLFVCAPPLVSLDVFSYISYARLGALHGLNPYDFAPASLAHDAAAIRVQDYRDATSVYGPLFTLSTYPLGWIGVPAAMWALKAATGASVLGIAALVARFAPSRGLASAPAAALVALNPLVLVQVVGGAHNDALMVLGLLGGVALVMTGREAAGGASVAVAFAVKAAAVAAPFVVLGAGSRQRQARVLAGAAVALAALAAASLAAFGGSALDGLSLLSGSQQTVSYHSIPATAARLFGVDVDPVRIAFQVGYAALALWLVIWTVRGGDWVRAAAWATVGLLCATVYLTPWYLLWALPLAALARDRVVLALTLALSAYQLSVGIPG
jgi:alpha-1,6-mannosyltransferase